jgi:hypothetical protein
MEKAYCPAKLALENFAAGFESDPLEHPAAKIATRSATSRAR